MFGLQINAKCPICGRLLADEVSGTQLYKINDIQNIDYIKTKCDCGRIIFVDTSGRYEAETLEEKHKIFEGLSDFLGTSETTFNMLIETGYFLNKGTKAIALEADTKVEESGIAMF